MCIHRHRRFAKRRIQNDIRRLAPDARQAFKRLPASRYLAIMLVDENAAGFDDVLGLAIEEANRLDMTLQPGESQVEDRLGRVGFLVQRGSGLVDGRAP